MAVIDRPTSHREELGLVVERADQQFAIAAVLITLDTPVVAFLSGSRRSCSTSTWHSGRSGSGSTSFSSSSPAVAGTAPRLRELLTSDDTTVQHNAVEALAVLAGPRPDIVAPAVEDLRTLLAHEDVAIQHNAAWVLGRLAKEYPDTVMQAVEELRNLDHDDEAVQRVATGALARPPEEYPETG